MSASPKPAGSDAIAHHADGDLLNNDKSAALRGGTHPGRKPVEAVCPNEGIVLLKFVSKYAAERLFDVIDANRQPRPRRPSLSYALRKGVRTRGLYWRFAEPDSA